MKLFNRGGQDATKATPTGPAAVVAAPSPQPHPQAPLAAPPPAPEPVPEAPAGPDLSSILDANVKEMSEKISRLASNLENAQEERTGLESKIAQMEDRMRKLSSLTEMISAQYNPFVGEAPAERDPPPVPEVGLAPPPAPPAAASASMAAPPVAIPGLASIALDAPPETPAEDSWDAPLGKAEAFAPPEAAYPSGDYAPPENLEQALSPSQAQEGPAHLWTIHPCFESYLLMLSWADMLLKHVPDRGALSDLLEYYQNIGWIGAPAKDQLLAYAEGIALQPTAGRDEWRASFELHEKTLLFVEKLKAVASRRPASG